MLHCKLPHMLVFNKRFKTSTVKIPGESTSQTTSLNLTLQLELFFRWLLCKGLKVCCKSQIQVKV